MNSFALVTGGSKGIGFEMARELAKRNHNLILVARSESELKAATTKLKDEYNIEAYYLATDLSHPDSPSKIIGFIQQLNLRVNMLVNNAGFGLWGSFEELSFEEQEGMMMVNMINLLKLTHLLLPELKKHSKAYILNVSSTAAYQAVPNLNVYSASKSFVLSFSRALKYELKNTPISVSCVSPGAVSSNFMNRAGMVTKEMKKRGEKFSMEASVVAAKAIEGMLRGKNEMIPGFTFWLSAQLTSFVPKWITEKIAAGLYKK